MGISIVYYDIGNSPQSKLIHREFTPPEWEVSEEYTTAVDIYQFGLTLNFMLTG
jgi:hypothetical protein